MENKMDLTKIKALTMQIKELEEELKLEKEVILEYFRNMSEEDKALNECRVGADGLVIQYFPKSTTKQVDSAKMKADGIYDQYVKEVSKTDYVKVTLSKEGK